MISVINPKKKCNNCKSKLYQQIDNSTHENHLTGKIVAGIYLLLPDETCWFLAIDFDVPEWKKDVTTQKLSCGNFLIPVAVERS